MAAVRIPPDVLAAARRYGPSVDSVARQYTNPRTGRPLSGTALLLKLSSGENHFRQNTGVSSAGARSATQFAPGSRRTVMERFGIDPWRSVDEAFHAASLHLRGKVNGRTGLEGYNPGDPHYPSYILSQPIGRGVTNGASGGAGAAPAGLRGAAAGSVPEPGSTALATFLAQQLQQPQQRAVGQLEAPGFAAKVAFPSGPALGSVAPPASQGGLADALAAIRQTSGPTIPIGSAASNSAAGGGGGGKVLVAPGAERPGVGLQKPVLGFLHELSSVAGRPVRVTTGTNHNQFVVGTRRQSDHWDGNAADLGVPVDSKQGDLIAAHAIQVAGGVPFRQALGMARRGGVWSFDTDRGRVQILWRTDVGGNHHNHVHIGVRPG